MLTIKDKNDKMQSAIVCMREVCIGVRFIP